MFTLDPRLQQDTIELGEFSLCKVLLMNDTRYPWVILVPKITGLTEVFELNYAQQLELMLESNFVAQALKELVGADKMNVASLGNVVSQLHIHHVARFLDDQAWPAPVWGKGQALPYNKQEIEAVSQQLKSVFVSLLQDGN
jgi:diadenosine tetraphosphate (Ap4A) HIT family hydrolase